MYGYNPSAADQRDVMQTLRDAGVATVTIEFSGGNDEGGPDGIDYLDAAGNKVDTIPSSNAYEDRAWDPTTRTYGAPAWVVHLFADGKFTQRPATDDEVKASKIAQVLEFPIYDRWGSFAGEFYVQGTVTWDVVTGTHKVTGQESHEVWEDFDE